MRGKQIATTVLLIAVIFYQYSGIYVPDGFERPLWYKTKSTLMGVFGATARLASKLKLAPEPIAFKKILSKSSSFLKIIHAGDYNDIEIEETLISSVKVRIYTPSVKGSKDNLPVMLYYHGGAYVFGDLDAFEPFMIEISRQSQVKVISVDYRMAPEHPIPIPMDDCFRVTKYVIENPHEFNVDIMRLILAGDSAGGNAVSVVAQRLVKQNSIIQPKLQVLIYPWTQMYNTIMPSSMFYSEKGFLSHSGFSFAQYRWWLCGLHNITQEMIDAVMNNQHQLLIKDESLRKKYESYLDIDLIPEKYRNGHSYYENYKSQKMQEFIYPRKTNENSFFSKNQELANLFYKQITPEISPGLADDEILAKLPHAYLVVLEWDSLKDEGLIYAERLRRNGVKVEVAFYEKVYHGMIPFVGSTGYDASRKILKDLVDYIKINV